MRLLMVKLSAFGDIIHCLPALEDALAAGCEVHWLLDRRYRFVRALFPSCVVVHEVDLKGKRSLRATMRCVHRLRRLGFARIVDVQGLMKSALLARAIGGEVMGMDARYVRERPAAMLQKGARFDDRERHVVQQYRKVVHVALTGDAARVMPYAPPRVRDEVRARFRPLDEARALAAQLGRYVLLHVGGGWATKRLPDKTWLALAEGLTELGVTPVFAWGNEAEQRLAGALASRSDGRCLPRRFDLSSLAHLLAHARAVVGADTGVLHLAAALDRPTVTFWGPSASWRSGPQGKGHRHVESHPRCGPCFKRTCDHFTCMDEIRASAILEALHESGAV
ncbi:MAG: lipopolysaccharide heptosyltransferase family protein [Zetaproteobacteria bacterium]|nr:MAG: lipopolysaccharide heptosyltransferase family protein [Zetaproteobacteria bacterium]